MKKILLAVVMLAFLAACLGPSDTDRKSSQKVAPKDRAAAHNHLMKDFGKKRVTNPMQTWPGGESREETIKEIKKTQKQLDADIKELKEGQK